MRERGKAMKPSNLCTICLLSLLLHSITSSQVLKQALPAKEFELGYQWKYFHRDLTHRMDAEAHWAYNSLYMRYGINKWITLSVEGGVNNVWFPEPEEGDYRVYIIGGGVTSCICDVRGFNIGLAIHYSEAVYFDRSLAIYHNVIRAVVAGVRIERALSLRKQNLTILILPAYIYDENAVYDCRIALSKTEKSHNNFGVAAGVDLLLINHIGLFCHIVFADYFQPRLGFGYQF